MSKKSDVTETQPKEIDWGWENAPNITDLDATLKGLTDDEVDSSKEQYGVNKMTPKKVATVFEMFIGALDDPCAKILMAVLGVKLLFVFLGIWIPQFRNDSDLVETASIFAALCLSTGISTLAEYRNTSRSSALQAEYSKTYCKVMRNGGITSILTSEIVRGDIILLQSGDKVPVDGLIIDGGIQVSQAALNGESRNENKTATLSMENATTNDYANENKVFMGSVVESGEAYMIATVLGDSTELGKINLALNEAESEERKDATSIKLEKMLKQINILGTVCAVLAGIVTIICSFARGTTVFQAMSIVSLILVVIMKIAAIIIMAVPEGLATVVSLVQKMNTENLYKHNILVSHKANYSDSAFMSILFSDKTGTITYGKLTLVEWLNGAGEIKTEPTPELIDSITINNNSRISEGKAIGSNNMDRALLTYAMENGYSEEDSKHHLIKKLNEFNSEKKCATAEMKDGSVYWKGATENIIDKVTNYVDGDETKEFTQENKRKLLETMKQQAQRAMKLLSVAKIEGEKVTLIAVLCCRDDVRPEARMTVKKLGKSGINVVMVTGDNLDTAVAIAKDAGIYKEEQKHLVLTHDELESLSDEELKDKLPKLRVVSRAKPLDKQRLVKIAQELGHVVGMTGDGRVMPGITVM